MGHYVEQKPKHNGATSLDHFKPSDIDLDVVEIEPDSEPEEGQTMPPVKKEDFASSIGKQVLIMIVIGLLTAAATVGVESVRSGAKSEYQERRMTEIMNENVLMRTRLEIVERDNAVLKAQNQFVSEVRSFKDEVIKEIKRR